MIITIALLLRLIITTILHDYQLYRIITVTIIIIIVTTVVAVTVIENYDGRPGSGLPLSLHTGEACLKSDGTRVTLQGLVEMVRVW